VFLVRVEQSLALRAVYLEDFEERTARNLLQWFPAEYNRIGEAGVRERISASARRAQELGAVTEADLGKYIVMEFALGDVVMCELVASVRELRRARDASCTGSMFIEAVCRAGIVRLERERDPSLGAED